MTDREIAQQLVDGNRLTGQGEAVFVSTITFAIAAACAAAIREAR